MLERYWAVSEDLPRAAVIATLAIVAIWLVWLLFELVRREGPRLAILLTGIAAALFVVLAVLRPVEVKARGSKLGPKVLVLVDQSRRLTVKDGPTHASNAHARCSAPSSGTTETRGCPCTGLPMGASSCSPRLNARSSRHMAWRATCSRRSTPSGAAKKSGPAQSLSCRTVGFRARLRVSIPRRSYFVATNEAEFATVGEPDRFPTSAAKREAVSFPYRVPAFIPISYISDSGLRIKAYREIAEITTRDQLQRLRNDWRDRFGRPPEAVDNLWLLGEIKLAAAEAGISRVEVREGKVMLTRRGDFILVGGKFPRLVTRTIQEHLGELLETIKKL